MESPSGMSVEMNSNGSIRRMNHGDIMLNLFPGNGSEGGPTNIYLRLLGENVESIPLLGNSGAPIYQSDGRGMTAGGMWRNIAFQLKLVLAESAAAWFWHVSLENTGPDPLTCDLILTQDLALAHYGAVRLNEYYVSQYLDHFPMEHPEHGMAVASRQNQSMGGSFPWTVTGSLGRAVSYATDALQFHGLATRAGLPASALIDGLPGKRLQHEHAMVCLQEEPFNLPPGAKSQRGFFGWFEADKPAASSAADAAFIEAALALPEAAAPAWAADISCDKPASSLFSTAPLLETLELGESETDRFFSKEKRHPEYEDGKLLSYFYGDHRHVVLKAKELQVLRPHGHLLRTGGGLAPDESALTSTAWMGGTFHSMVTQGHVSINRFLSTCHSYLGLFRSHGQRVFVELDGQWHLLDQPSAFEMHPQSCRWIYKHPRGLIEVVSSAVPARHELHLAITIHDGPPARFLVSNHVAMNGDDGSQAIPAQYELCDNGVIVRAVPDSDVGRRFPNGGFLVTPAGDTVFETIGGDELLFADGVSRGEPFLCLVSKASRNLGLTIEGRLLANVPPQDTPQDNALLRISAPDGCPLAAEAGRLEEMFPWFIQNALVHYLSPRGLEQYSGGGWGTRDVCQGPVELLLSLGRFEPVRGLLARVFSQQNPDGDWPQWFMFFDRERNIRPADSHGDIVYWPVLALAQYLSATGDAGFLDEPLPFFHPDGAAAAENATLWQHVERALEVMFTRVIAGTNLAAYGHGDWNDSLQPVKPEMRERLCSSWTVTLNYQTFTALAGAFRRIGNSGRAAEFDALAENILEEFQRVLIVDDVIAGFAYFHENGSTEFMLHPRDKRTGLSYSLLPMIHAIINDMLTPRQAETHLSVIRKHLLGPDGAHLFDRPMLYQGGLQTIFQRAESASFFGREIGIMYMHAHLRYAEALARFGDADAFFHALCQACPIAIREIVPSAAMRQANCYYSSSDPAFADRYEAYAEYDRVSRGEVALEGGWRVYSSGAGISVRLVMQCFLGLRQEKEHLVVDPVVPMALDGMRVTVELAGHALELLYRISENGRGPVSVNLNGVDLDFIRENNPYRPGAARIPMSAILQGLVAEGNRITVWIA